MPTGIGSGIAGDVFQNFLGDGSGGGGGVPVCPSNFSFLQDGVSQLSGIAAANKYVLGATSSTFSVWVKTPNRAGNTSLGQGLYANNLIDLVTRSSMIFFDSDGVLQYDLSANISPGFVFKSFPELITNGSFTEVPVGTELIANPTFSDAASITPWQITGTPNATKSWSARFMRVEYTVATGSALFQGSLGQTLNTMYSVKMRVRGVTSAGADQGSAFANIGDSVALTSANIISNPTLTSQYQDYEFRVWSTGAVFRFYLASAAIGDVVDFDSISVKPITMLVDNGNFGNGTTDWSNDGSSTISVGTHAGRDDVADINITGTGTGDRITQPFTWTEGKSYKVDVEVYLVSGSFRVDTTDGFVPGNFVETTTTGSWQTLTGYITATATGPNYLFVRSSLAVSQFYVDSISIEELGEDWGVQEPTGQSVVFSNNQLHVTYDAAATQGSTGVSQVALDFDTSYKITIDVAEVSGQFKVQVGANSQTINTTGIHTFYKKTVSTAGGDTLYLVRLTNAISTEFKINSISVEEVLSENEWHHLALSIDRDSEWKWYVDGVLTNTMDNGTDYIPVTNGNTGGIGTSTLTVLGQLFEGNITETSLWNIPLSASEVKDIYDNMYGGQRCLGSLPFTSDLITNGNFTQIGPELITNGDFSATGSELVVNGNFLSASSWNVNSNWNINTALGVAEADGTSDADINQSVWLPVIGKSYKVTFEVVSRSQGDVLFKLGGVTGQTHNTLGIKTEYIVATSTDRLKIDSQSSFIGSVTNVSVKELGEDWTDSGTPLKSATFDENGLTITSVNGNGNGNRVSQASVTEDAKSYKVTYTINSATLTGTNVFQYYNGSDYVTFSEQGVGTHTFYYTRQGVNNNFFLRISTNDGSTTDFVTISSISVQEVGQNWTVINSDATHYVEFPGVGARYVSDTTTPDLQLKQAGIITPGKAYTVTCNVAYASGSGDLKFNVGGAFSTPFTEGFNTKTVTAGVGTDFYFLRDAANVDCVITNVTVTQVGGGNLERWWRMNGTDDSSYIVGNQAPNGTVNNQNFSNSPLIEREVP